MIKLVGLDRDGTINEDNNYYLGSSSNWKEQVKILEGVVEGITKLNSLPKTKVFIVTNQSGVALTGPKFAELTEKRMHEVNEYVIELLSKQGAKVQGYFACPFVDNKYVKKVREKGWRVNPDYVKERHPDRKPNIGMLERCAESLGYCLDKLEVYTIGDRFSDVGMGLNAGGRGILLSSPKNIELGDVKKAKKSQKLNPGRIFIARDFLDATSYIS